MKPIQIKYYTRTVYGRPLSYLADAQLADWTQALTGSKTVTESNRHVIAQLATKLSGQPVEFVEVVAPRQ